LINITINWTQVVKPELYSREEIMRKPKVAVMCAVLFAMFFVLCLTPAFSQDVEGSKDHPMFTRLPNYYIDTYEENEFDAYDGFVDSSGNYKTVEGRKFHINYHFKEGTEYLSEAQIKGNYREAFKKIGGVVEYEDSYNVHMSLDKGGKVTWVHIHPWNGGQGIELYIIEEKAMVQYVVADADTLAKEISLTGKVAVYGILFDTGKAVVKPDSKPALEEIAKLLKKDTGLNIYVVGHTDSVGSFDSNMSLSMARAEAVVDVLVKEYKIDSGRLKAHGVGPLVPASTNRSKDGRVVNRRVELVEQ
jgi:outer membrane protein OmpA-like peptidoglycan-associated protein